MRVDKHKRQVIYITIGILLLLTLYALKNTSYFVRASTFVFSVILFYVGDRFFNLDFKIGHYIILVLIAAGGILLSPLYFLYSGYDKILHLVSPFLLGFLVFFLVNKIKMKLSTKLLITFSVIIASLAIFEIIEYIIDQFFNFQLQGVFVYKGYAGLEKLNIVMDKNEDTMIDLILGTVGTLIFTGYKTLEFYYKTLILKQKA
tara:strand:+ start:181 stop:789 length:609 start_codon:yes stop_codon:yes gene_type:complete